MGFPLVCYCLNVPKPLIAFCRLLSAIRDAVLLVLALLGLCPFPHDYGSGSGSGSGSAGAHRQRQPDPEEVKAQLPAVAYAQLLAEHHQQSSSSGSCIVCLETLEAADEVRRLGNCAHAFHRACVDRWIDLGRPTCPLCRSDLLPRRPTGRAGLLGLGRLATRLTRVW